MEPQEQQQSTAEAVQSHRNFLQEVLAEVMKVLSFGPPSDERLIAALEVYWEACFARREVRRVVIESTRGSEVEHSIEPMGKPFLMMVRAELLPQHGERADELALSVYDQARAIAVDEAVAGIRASTRREEVLGVIRHLRLH
jgi:hypothetical protein